MVSDPDRDVGTAVHLANAVTETVSQRVRGMSSTRTGLPSSARFAPDSDPVNACTRRRSRSRSVRQSRFGEALGDLVCIRRIAEGQPRHVLGEGVLRVDLLQLGPDLPGFVEVTEMAER